VLIVAIVTAGLLGTAWPAGVHTWLAIAAVPIALCGLYVFLGGIAGLGRQLTPFPKPVEHGGLRRAGVFGLVRHPMYGGALLLALAWSLVSSPVALLPLVVAGVFLEAKRRREEAWLVEKHPDYDEYRRRVRASFVPFVW